jgi:hypothetical protein
VIEEHMLTHGQLLIGLLVKMVCFFQVLIVLHSKEVMAGYSRCLVSRPLLF